MRRGLEDILKSADTKQYDAVILQAFDQINGVEFSCLCADFFEKTRQKSVLEQLKLLAEARGVEYYLAQLVLVMSCASKLRELYRKKGYPEEIFLGILRDFKAKIEECLRKFHTVGTDDAEWLGSYFTFELFAIGRLSYELNVPHGYSYSLHGKSYSIEELSLSIHIPSGKSLLREDVVSSLKGAYEFFSDRRIDGVLPTVCLSWLLFPPYEEMFNGGNLKTFRNMFDIVGYELQDKFYNGWRVFGVSDLSNPDGLPQNTSLQKKFAQWLRRNGEHGYGAGVLLFDGETILTEQSEQVEN